MRKRERTEVDELRRKKFVYFVKDKRPCGMRERKIIFMVQGYIEKFLLGESEEKEID